MIRSPHATGSTRQAGGLRSLGCAMLAAATFLLAACLISPARADQKEQRIALVIGNALYPDGEARLPTPEGDTRAIADALTVRGFAAATAMNLKKAEMKAAIDVFLAKVTPGSAAFFYFGGFGLQAGGKVYLIPVDAQIWSEADVLREGVSLDGLLDLVSQRGATTTIAVIDASRRNPFERRFRSVSAGLSAPADASGRVTLMSAPAGLVLADSGGPTSVFGVAVAEHILSPGVDVEKAFAAVRSAVAAKTENRQEPALAARLATPFAFEPKPVSAVAQAKGLAPAHAPIKPAAPIQETPNAPPPQAALAPQPASPVSPPPPPAPRSPQPSAVKPATTAFSVEERAHLVALDTLITRNAADEAAITERGQIYAQHRDYDRALEDFDRLARLNPENADALNNRCWLRAIHNQTEKALTDCDEALRIRPGNADALDSRGLAHLKAGDFRAALADYEAALKASPKHASALYGRGLARKRLGELAAAEKDFEAARAQNPGVAADYDSYDVR